MNPFPFRRSSQNPDLDRTISEIVAPRNHVPAKPAKPYDKYGDPRDKYGDKKKGGKTTGRGKTVTTYAVESHTRKELEGLSISRLRELKKKYERLVLRGDRDASRELADIRGILRGRGAGSVLEEGRKGLGKTAYGKALGKMGKAVEDYKAAPKPTPPVNPFKKPVAEGMTPCEKSALARLKSANTEDLKEKPGAAGEAAHKRLHTTIGSILKKR